MDAMKLLMLLVLLIAVIAGIIALTQAQRRIAIQYAKRVVGRKVYGGQTQYMPLKVNYAGVMPIIFAQAILLFPSQIIGFLFPESQNVQQLGRMAHQRLALRRHLHRAHLLLQLLLGGHHVPAQPDRRGPQAQRRLHSRPAPRQAHGGFPRLHHEPPDLRRRALPDPHLRLPAAAADARCRSTPPSASSSAAPAS